MSRALGALGPRRGRRARVARHRGARTPRGTRALQGSRARRTRPDARCRAATAPLAGAGAGAAEAHAGGARWRVVGLLRHARCDRGRAARGPDWHRRDRGRDPGGSPSGPTRPRPRGHRPAMWPARAEDARPPGRARRGRLGQSGPEPEETAMRGRGPGPAPAPRRPPRDAIGEREGARPRPERIEEESHGPRGS